MSDSDLDAELEKALSKGYGPAAARFSLAFLGGLIPVAGGAVGGATSAWSEKEQAEVNRIIQAWLRLQEDEIREIATTVMEVMERLDLDDERIQARLESPEYLNLVKKCFRDWSAAESEEKRAYIRNLLVNATGETLTPDDVLSQFVTWIDRYSEAHFKIVRAVFNNEGVTRRQIWDTIDGEQVREDSAKADMFRLLMHELSVGRLIVQSKPKDAMGRVLKVPASQRVKNSSMTHTSAFEDRKGYELTELGKQFVHYTMNDIVKRLASENDPQDKPAPPTTSA